MGEWGRRMWGTNLRILGVVLGTLAVYTAIANSIPQVQSEVPRALTLAADVTPEELVRAGQEVYASGGGCTACHGLGTRSCPSAALSAAGETCHLRR